MRDTTSHRIDEQDSSYRRGLVLGLTMAEVGILIIFILLLMLALGEWSREQENRARREKVLVAKTTLQSLRNSDEVAQEVAKAVGLGPNAAPDEILPLVRALQAIATTADGQSTLVRARDELAKLEDARQRLERAAGAAESTNGESIAKQLEQQSYELANKEGQLKRYEKQLSEAGFGKGERPCWVQPDGTIEYLYDVVLSSDGIKMREYQYPNRAPERSLLPMPEVNPAELLTPAEFLRRTEPLFTRSVADNCRFFVVVYDDTGPTEKELYKHLLETVEGHFYKRLDDGSAPF